MRQNETVLTAKKAAEWLGISRATFYRKKKKGLIKPNKLKKYRLSDLRKLI